MLTCHSLSFISTSSNNWAIIVNEWSITNELSELSEMSERSERIERSERNEWVLRMSEQKSEIVRWGRNKTEWVTWQHFLYYCYHSIFRTTEARVGFSRKPLKKFSKSSTQAAGSDFWMSVWMNIDTLTLQHNK